MKKTTEQAIKIIQELLNTYEAMSYEAGRGLLRIKHHEGEEIMNTVIEEQFSHIPRWMIDDALRLASETQH